MRDRRIGNSQPDNAHTLVRREREIYIYIERDSLLRVQPLSSSHQRGLRKFAVARIYIREREREKDALAYLGTMMREKKSTPPRETDQ